LVVEQQAADLGAEGPMQVSQQESAGSASGHEGSDSLEPARLLAGDTLFERSIGRTDLWGGSYPQIIESIREKLLVLPDEVVVYPGHGAQTTIGAEREHNPFLR
jgi:glyoxylase-like metal-dependent hydrolase (beta-lactamase superfamily II)